MIVLYEHPLSPYAQKVKIALREKQLDFEPRLPDLFSGHFVREYRDHRLEWMLRSGGIEIVIEGMQRRNIRFSHELK